MFNDGIADDDGAQLTENLFFAGAPPPRISAIARALTTRFVHDSVRATGEKTGESEIAFTKQQTILAHNTQQRFFSFNNIEHVY